MLDESRAHAEIRNGLMEEAVPPIDLREIHRRMSLRRDIHSGRVRGSRVAAALAAGVVASLFLTARSPALMESIHDRYVAALHAAGIGPRIPKPIPESLRGVAAPAAVSLAQAQREANFTVVPPAGLPQDVVSRKVLTSPLAVWSAQRKAWTADGVQVSFVYVRAGGRTFDIIASRNSARFSPASRYVYQADDVPPGAKPNQTSRKEQFLWRNGDQTLRAVTSDALSAREIVRIRTAMRGVPLPREERPPRKAAGDLQRFVISQ